LHWQILLGLIIGGLAGSMVAHSAMDSAGANVKPIDTVRGSGLFTTIKLIGELFLNGLKMIVLPLVPSSIVLAVASLSGAGIGRLGLKTLTYYMATSLIAILVGLALVNAISPGTDSQGRGILVGKDVATSFGDETSTLEAKTGDHTGSSFLNVFRKMVPPNIISAANEGNLLGLIVISLIAGGLLGKIESGPSATVKSFIEGVYQLSLRGVEFLLKFAPIGVGALIFCAVAENQALLGPENRFDSAARGVVIFAGVAFAALLLHFLVLLPLLMLFVGRFNPIKHYRAMAPALLTAFSTASSSATLGVTMDCVEKRGGISNRVAGFTLPLGATVNMDGTALYECVAAMFLCQAMGVELSAGQQFFVVLTALLTSVGVAGVPSASLVAIVVILRSLETQLGINTLVVAIPVLLVFDRPLDMCRTAVNVFSDSVGAALIAKSEGEPIYKHEPHHAPGHE
jgi:proton glutamate symport protein